MNSAGGSEESSSLATVPANLSEKDVFFLIAQFLSRGPCTQAHQVLIKELEENSLIPKRTDWLGNNHSRSYDEYASSLPTPPAHLLSLLGSLSSHVNNVAPLPQTCPKTNLLGTGRLSLLRKSNVTRQEYTTVKSILSTVRGSRRIVENIRPSEPVHPNICLALKSRSMNGMLKPYHVLSNAFYKSKSQLHKRTVGHLAAVYCVLFDKSGRYIVTGSDDHLVKVWSALDGRLVATLRGAAGEISDISIDPENLMIAAGSCDKIIRVWSLQTLSPIAVLMSHSGMVTALLFCPGPMNSSGEGVLVSTGGDGCVAFWTYTKNSEGEIKFRQQPIKINERVRPGHSQLICASFSYGGTLLAFGGVDHHVRVYRFSEQEGLEKLVEQAHHKDCVDSIQWSHTDLAFVSGSRDGKALIWRYMQQTWHTTELDMMTQLPGETETPHADDTASTTVTSTSNRGTTTTTTVSTVTKKKLMVTMVGWSLDDAFVITCSSDHKVRLWHSQTGKLEKVMSGHSDDAFVIESHPLDRRFFFTAGHDGQLIIWNIDTASVVKCFKNGIDGQGYGALFDAKWSPDGRKIVATDSHGHLCLFGIEHNDKFDEIPEELFFDTDYRPLVRDVNHHVLDEQTQMAPHLLPPPFLVNMDGDPYPPRLQRLVPGREDCTDEQLVPVALPNNSNDDPLNRLLNADFNSPRVQMMLFSPNVGDPNNRTPRQGRLHAINMSPNGENPDANDALANGIVYDSDDEGPIGPRPHERLLGPSPSSADLAASLSGIAGTSSSLSGPSTNPTTSNQTDSSSYSNPGPSGSGSSMASGSSTPGPSGSSNAGPSGSSNAGPSGSSNAGPSGSSIAGQSGSSIAGPSGSSIAGPSGSNNTGSFGSSVAGSSTSRPMILGTPPRVEMPAHSPEIPLLLGSREERIGGRRASGADHSYAVNPIQPLQLLADVPGNDGELRGLQQPNIPILAQSTPLSVVRKAVVPPLSSHVLESMQKTKRILAEQEQKRYDEEASKVPPAPPSSPDIDLNDNDSGSPSRQRQQNQRRARQRRLMQRRERRGGEAREARDSDDENNGAEHGDRRPYGTRRNRETGRGRYSQDYADPDTVPSGSNSSSSSSSSSSSDDASDYSDWTAEQGVNLEPPKRTTHRQKSNPSEDRTKRRRRRVNRSSSASDEGAGPSAGPSDRREGELVREGRSQRKRKRNPKYNDNSDAEEQQQQPSTSSEPARNRRIRREASERVNNLKECSDNEEYNQDQLRYRPPEWLTETLPKRAPYVPQMGDELVYFMDGHLRYSEAVKKRGLYAIDDKALPWNKENNKVRSSELVKIVGIKYEVTPSKPTCLCCLKLAIMDEKNGKITPDYFILKYHDIPDVLDFLILKQLYDICTNREWEEGDRFKCLIDDAWWMGTVQAIGPLETKEDNFLCYSVRWDNGETERLSPWDMEPFDEDDSELTPNGGSIPIEDGELENLRYKWVDGDWGKSVNGEDECSRLAEGVGIVMGLAPAEAFIAPVDFSLYPNYALIVAYPMDLSTVKNRLENGFYRRLNAVQFDVRCIATNAEKYNRKGSSIVRQANIVTELCLHLIRNPSCRDPTPFYHQISERSTSFRKMSSSLMEESEDDTNAAGPSGVNGVSHRSPQVKSSLPWKEQCINLLKLMYAKTDSDPFKYPVDLSNYPDYTQLVEIPADLNSIGSELLSGNYESPYHFARDIRLIFSNSKAYNTDKRSRIFVMTLRLEAYFESNMEPILNFYTEKMSTNKRDKKKLTLDQDGLRRTTLPSSYVKYLQSSETLRELAVLNNLNIGSTPLPTYDTGFEFKWHKYIRQGEFVNTDPESENDSQVSDEEEVSDSSNGGGQRRSRRVARMKRRLSSSSANSDTDYDPTNKKVLKKSRTSLKNVSFKSSGSGSPVMTNGVHHSDSSESEPEVHSMVKEQKAPVAKIIIKKLQVESISACNSDEDSSSSKKYISKDLNQKPKRSRKIESDSDNKEDDKTDNNVNNQSDSSESEKENEIPDKNEGQASSSDSEDASDSSSAKSSESIKKIPVSINVKRKVVPCVGRKMPIYETNVGPVKRKRSEEDDGSEFELENEVASSDEESSEEETSKRGKKGTNRSAKISRSAALKRARRAVLDGDDMDDDKDFIVDDSEVQQEESSSDTTESSNSSDSDADSADDTKPVSKKKRKSHTKGVSNSNSSGGKKFPKKLTPTDNRKKSGKKSKGGGKVKGRKIRRLSSPDERRPVSNGSLKKKVLEKRREVRGDNGEVIGTAYTRTIKEDDSSHSSSESDDCYTPGRERSSKKDVRKSGRAQRITYNESDEEDGLNVSSRGRKRRANTLMKDFVSN